MQYVDDRGIFLCFSNFAFLQVVYHEVVRKIWSQPIQIILKH